MAVAILGITVLALPLVGLVQRAPWTSLGDLLGRRSVLESLRVSLTAVSYTHLTLPTILLV